MILRILPVLLLKGSIRLPASKSYSIRASFIAACGGKSSLHNLSDCDDAVVAQRVSKALRSSSKTFLVGESGTTLRFLLPLLSLYVKRAVVKGKGTLIGRPNMYLCQTLRDGGMDIRGSGKQESVPIVYKGGKLKPGHIRIEGSLSSQFISALLIALPQLKGNSRLIVTGKTVVSRDYIVMTRQILAKTGVKIRSISQREFFIKGNQTFIGLKNFYVPSDYGLAAFPLAAAALLPSKVLLKGHFKDDLTQSDGHILGFLRKMGVSFKKTSSTIAIRGPFVLKGGSFSLKDCPDLVPIMAVLALFAKGRTKLTDIYHARSKESDRISDLRKELLKVGADVRETTGTLTIIPRNSYRTGQLLDSHQDHRLAMAWTVLGMKIGVRVKGIESCSKSYPRFVDDMRALGLQC